MPDRPAFVPRLVIAAPQGRSGKTTVSLGLCAAFASRGLHVQPFKKGPDYIDPSWLTEAAGNPCRNLDPFFMPSAEALTVAFARAFVERGLGHGGARGLDHEAAKGIEDAKREGHEGVSPSAGVGALGAARGTDLSLLALIEGNHGLYDSLDEDGSGSTAAVARALSAPVLLVVNTARMGRSVAAMVYGYMAFEPDTPIRGVILNNVARGRHEDKLRQAVERHCGVPVLGALPRSDALTIPDRHLGLVPRTEDNGLIPALDAARAAVERNCDLDAILAAAHAAPALRLPGIPNAARQAGRQPVIAVFRDRAFSFYYHENLEALADAGADLVFVDAFSAGALPACDLLYIGGGFPEVFMEDLAANRPLMDAVRRAAGEGLPVYAECGGLMYLARQLSWGGRSAQMAGVLPVDVEVAATPQGHGYVEAVVDGPNPFFEAGTVVRGHEFHNSRLVGERLLPTVYRLQRGTGVGGGRDALLRRGVLASYTHLHAAGAPDWPAGMVRAARG